MGASDDKLPNAIPPKACTHGCIGAISPFIVKFSYQNLKVSLRGTEIGSVESLYANDVNLAAGTTLTAIFHVNGRPCPMFCTVHSEAPFFLYSTDETIGNLEFPKTVMLLWQTEGQLYKGEAEVIGATEYNTGHLMEVSRLQWMDLNRRRYPRVGVTVPVALRAVHDVHGDTTISIFQGETVDLSLGGAWVKLTSAIEVGSLVEFQATISPTETVRAFGIVAHSDKNRKGVGIEFLDYVGATQSMLHGYLARVA